VINKQAEGVKGTPFDLDVERGKIAEFAEAEKASHPAHFLRDGATIPPTFLSTTLAWDKRVSGANPWAQVNMSEKRGMHAEQEYIFHGAPPKAGDRLTCQHRISEIREKTNRNGSTLTFVKMITEFRNEAGELVAEAILTGVEKGE